MEVTLEPAGDGSSTIDQPAFRHLAEGPGGRQPPLGPLLLQHRGKALIDRALGAEQPLACHGQRHARRSVPSKRERLAASVETVVVAEGDGTGGRYRHVHTIAIKNLINLGLKLEIAQCCVGKHCDGFYRQRPGDPLILGKPHEIGFPEEFFTLKDLFGLNSKQEGLDPTSGGLPSVLSPTRSAGRR